MEASILARQLKDIEIGILQLKEKAKKIRKLLGHTEKPVVEASIYPAIGEALDNGVIVGIHAKVQLLKKDGTVGSVSKFVKLEGE